MKVITMYLPQFHRVKENDEWWGEGFTDWIATRRAEKLFPDHYQPHVPLNNNYYDLLNKKTMKWQADLMKQYEVDGQCFYHYWFKDGRKILEKPAENLLRWNDVDMPFCFCWANGPWGRSWSNLKSKNVWASTFEKKGDTTDSGILLEQKYGGEDQWKAHFDYLLPFFKDNRYIKIDNRPLFVIHQAAQVSCLGPMRERWNAWAIDEGFDGVYIIGANSKGLVEKSLDAILYHEPQYTTNTIRNNDKKHKDLFRLEYDDVWNTLLKYRSNKKNVLYEAFVGFDDTPRRGKIGKVIEHATPEKFKKYLSELIAKTIANDNDLIFINAWNEWGEGMHLEPDERFQYGFLEAIPYAKRHYKEYLVKYERDSDLRTDEELLKEIEMWSDRSARYESYWRIFDAWLRLKEEQCSLEQYFIKHNFNSIAIYGLGMMGRHLLKELENGKVQIKYALDSKADHISADIKVYFPEEALEEVDAIVVTVTYDYLDIKRRLQERGFKNIILLQEIIEELV